MLTPHKRLQHPGEAKKTAQQTSEQASLSCCCSYDTAVSLFFGWGGDNRRFTQASDAVETETFKDLFEATSCLLVEWKHEIRLAGKLVTTLFVLPREIVSSRAAVRLKCCREIRSVYFMFPLDNRHLLLAAALCIATRMCCGFKCYVCSAWFISSTRRPPTKACKNHRNISYI